MTRPTIAIKTQTRYLKRTNSIKSSNFHMDLDTLDAYSYDWWLFCTKTKTGKVIFNNTTYSQTTVRHQGKARSALFALGFDRDITLKFTTANLTNLENALNKEIEGARYEVRELIRLIRKPRTHKAKNQERRKEIRELLKHIRDVQSIKKEL